MFYAPPEILSVSSRLFGDVMSSSRRAFLGAAATAAAATTFTAKSYARIVGANDRLRLGFIGAGGMANSHFDALVSIKETNNLEPVAVADCWLERAQKGAEKLGAPKSFQDYKAVLDIKDIDYVTVATPEHWHSKMTIDALAAGKHVYCKKPMTHSIPEPLGGVAPQ